MTSQRKESCISDLRSKGHDTHGCVPVRGSVVRHHAAVSGDAAKVSGMTSPLYMGEANLTADGSKDPEVRTRRSPGFVFVLSADRKPLNPCRSAYARRLLRDGKAAVFRRFPFTIILKERKHEDSSVSEHRLKLDPGSKTTGIAVLKGETVVFAAELTHRGQRIVDGLTARRALRRLRRNRHTRYRAPRFDHRRRPEGWLAPSLEHLVLTIQTWVVRLRKVCPISAISMELARFDTQKMKNPEISGIEYQQGELAGYEVREYLLEKWKRKCAYCGDTKIPLQVEHIVPKSRGGSDRVSNLTLACEPCNKEKGSDPIETFLTHKLEVLKRILEHAKSSLKDAAAVNSTRWALYKHLKGLGLPVECGTGGRTKFNRTFLSVPKTHWLDAACVGASTPKRLVLPQSILEISAVGHGRRQMCGTDKFGFPIRHRTRRKRHFGFQTGDMVRAMVPRGKKAGKHIGLVLCRASGSFDIRTKKGRIGVNQKYCISIHRADGYSYVIGGGSPVHC